MPTCNRKETFGKLLLSDDGSIKFCTSYHQNRDVLAPYMGIIVSALRNMIRGSIASVLQWYISKTTPTAKPLLPVQELSSVV
jgi:hypothetical protein